MPRSAGLKALLPLACALGLWSGVVAAAGTAAPAATPAADPPEIAEAKSNCKFVATEKHGEETIEVECAKLQKPNGMKPPDKSLPVLPMLVQQAKEVWPDLKFLSILAAQIEQESCISLKHKRCWDSTAELKTDREYGFGLGQLTVKYDTEKTKGFNGFEEMKKLKDKKLEGWEWENRFDPEMQLRSMLYMNRNNFNAIKFPTANEVEKLAFMLSAYNGGLSAVLKDRIRCEAVKGCDPSRWFGHVELYSGKAKTVREGYGKSFFEINREYPVNVIFIRRPKYIAYTEGNLAPAAGLPDPGTVAGTQTPSAPVAGLSPVVAPATPAASVTATVAATPSATATVAAKASPVLTPKMGGVVTAKPTATATVVAMATTAAPTATPTPAAAATAAPGATPEPVAATYTSANATGPAELVAEVKTSKVGGKAVTSSPPALGRVGASTFVTIELPNAAAAATLKDRLAKKGTLEYPASLPDGRFRMRVEVVRK